MKEETVVVTKGQWEDYKRLKLEEVCSKFGVHFVDDSETDREDDENDYNDYSDDCCVDGVSYEDCNAGTGPVFDFKATVASVISAKNASGPGNFLTDFTDHSAARLDAAQCAREGRRDAPDALDDVQSVAGWMEDHVRHLSQCVAEARKAFAALCEQVERLGEDTEKALTVAGFVMDEVGKAKKAKKREEASE